MPNLVRSCITLLKFETSMVYIVKSRTALATQQDAVSNQTKMKQNKPPYSFQKFFFKELENFKYNNK